MNGRRGWWAAVAVGAAVAGGCHTAAKKDVNIPLVEEFKAPPQEDRFNNPPEQGYRKPDQKKEFKPGFGAGGGPGSPGGMRGPGM